ncbi:MAG: T9SS type A sorting domain-containing protein [Candidatus Zixiibacteriota bacterium]
MYRIILSIVILVLCINVCSADYLERIATLCIGDTLDYLGNTIESAGDMNNDGYNDVWIRSNPKGIDAAFGYSWLYLFYGGDPMDSIPDMAFNDTIYSIVNIGDMNADNYDDFIIKRGGPTKYLSLHFGGPTFSLTPNMIFPIHEQDISSFGLQEHIIGGQDIDGDGFPDLIVAEPVASLDYCGNVYIYSSYPSLDTIYDKILTVDGEYPDFYNFGARVEYIDSLNGQNYIAVSRTGNPSNNTYGSVFLYECETQPYTVSVDSMPNDTLYSPYNSLLSSYGTLLKNTGDLNNDSYNDLVIGTASSSDAWFYSGGPNFDSIPDEIIVPQFENLDLIGDVNNDTFPDFIASEDNQNGRAWIYYGGPDFDGINDMKVNYFIAETENFGRNVKGLGDVNGDGIDDFAIAAIVDDQSVNSGIVFIYAGYNGTPTDINESDDNIILENYYLKQNYPNPFNPTTTIEFELTRKSNVELTVYDILGRKVANLINQQMPVGSHTINWYGRNQNGDNVASGIYFYKIKTDQFSDTKKMVLVR